MSVEMWKCDDRVYNKGRGFFALDTGVTRSQEVTSIKERDVLFM
jgi:hypothetical protein